jgi:hypothetical protein
MGRHRKAFAEVLAQFHLAAPRKHQFEDWAKDQPDDVKRFLFRQWQARASEAEAAGRYVPNSPRYLRGGLRTIGRSLIFGKRCGRTQNIGPRSP